MSEPVSPGAAAEQLKAALRESMRMNGDPIRSETPPGPERKAP